MTEKTSTEHVDNNVASPKQEEAGAENDLQPTKTVDTIHNDEAMKVITAWAGDEHWEPSEEKALVRRLDKTLLVLLTLTYGLQYYDKSMLSQAVKTI